MNDDEADLVEQMAQMLAEGGLSRAAGRIWAWLLICEPPQQTAADLADTLHISRGAVSEAVRLLVTAGLVRRTSRRGDRRQYFHVPPGSTIAVLHARLPITTAWRRLADTGLEILADRPVASRARLQEVRDVYAFMEQELPSLLERFLEQRKDRTT
ncbi:MAG: MarR family transcriptional regulator [Candidatus Limnocylindrales bacterium]